VRICLRPTILATVVPYTVSLPPPPAGIGKLLALFGQYFGIGITILPKSHNWVFLTVRFGGNTF
jgi:hypothetical protein